MAKWPEVALPMNISGFRAVRYPGSLVDTTRCSPEDPLVSCMPRVEYGTVLESSS